MKPISDVPRLALLAIIHEYGRDIYKDAKRCKGLLLDTCNGYRREINMLITVIDDDTIFSEILNFKPSREPYSLLRSRLTDKLYEKYGFEKARICWGIDSWALGEEIITKDELSKLEHNDANPETSSLEPKATSPETSALEPNPDPMETDTSEPNAIYLEIPIIEQKIISLEIPIIEPGAAPPETPALESRKPPPETPILEPNVAPSETPALEPDITQREKRKNLTAKQVITVSQVAGSLYPSISAAIHAAQPGDTIHIEQGRYVEELTIDKPLTIIGVGTSRKDVVIEGTSFPCIRIKAIKCLIKGITFDGMSKSSASVDISKGKVVLQNCIIKGNYRECVLMHGPFCNPTFKNCKFLYQRKGGILIKECAQGTIEACEIREIAEPLPDAYPRQLIDYAGIMLQKGANLRRKGNASPYIKGSSIHYGMGKGVIIDNDAMILAGTTVEQDYSVLYETLNSYSPVSIEVKNQGKLIADKCEILDGKGNGLLVHQGGHGTITECIIAEHELAEVEIRQQGNLTIKGGKIHGGHQNGIFIHENGAATIDACKIYGNALANIKIEQGTQPVTINQCKIYGSKGSGILILDDEPGIVKVNDCMISHNNHAGIQIKKSQNSVVILCLIFDNEGCGILYDEMSKGRVEKCTIYRNKYAGIEVKSGRMNIQESSLSENPSFGFLIRKQGIAVLDNCAYDSNSRRIFRIEQGGQILIKGEKRAKHRRFAQYISFFRKW